MINAAIVAALLAVAPQQPDELRAGVTPEEAVKIAKLPDGFTLTCFASEPDVRQPIALAIDARGRLWVAEAYEYPIRREEGEGRDRILIFEDRDGDGRFDERKVFMENLNLVSGLEVGAGGVFIGAAPVLMFVPDRDGDDKPDGPPEILLDGWGYQDTHETLNTFIWGPDGWLYGCHGVFTFSNVGKPGAPPQERAPINAGVWRYHPTQRRFEVFAWGTSNPWGLDFNDFGHAFIEACVVPHLWFIAQGGRYLRQAGAHYESWIYDDLRPIGDHVHWAGDKGPHAGNLISSAVGGGHAHCGALIYLGDSFPPAYRNSIFIGNIHGNRLNNDRLERKGSGYVGRHNPDLLLANDRWFRAINLRTGPDGSVYLIDWYDRQPCHLREPEKFDRSNGRIYTIAYGKPRAAARDLPKLPSAELVKLQLHANDYFVRQSRRLLAERGPDTATNAALVKILDENPDVTRKLRALWALHGTGGLNPERLTKLLDHGDEHLRSWAVQLLCEDKNPGAAAVEKFVALATSDASPLVRLYLASALQRIPVAQRWPLLEALAARGEDAKDANLPLMIWFGAEPAIAADPTRAAGLLGKTKIPLLRQYVARRISELKAR
jgi:putative membrane-bound dehydrogenase-like protein